MIRVDVVWLVAKRSILEYFWTSQLSVNLGECEYNASGIRSASRRNLIIYLGAGIVREIDAAVSSMVLLQECAGLEPLITCLALASSSFRTSTFPKSYHDLESSQHHG